MAEEVDLKDLQRRLCLLKNKKTTQKLKKKKTKCENDKENGDMNRAGAEKCTSKTHEKKIKKSLALKLQNAVDFSSEEEDKIVHLKTMQSNSNIPVTRPTTFTPKIQAIFCIQDSPDMSFDEMTPKDVLANSSSSSSDTPCTPPPNQAIYVTDTPEEMLGNSSRHSSKEELIIGETPPSDKSASKPEVAFSSPDSINGESKFDVIARGPRRTNTEMSMMINSSTFDPQINSTMLSSPEHKLKPNTMRPKSLTSGLPALHDESTGYKLTSKKSETKKHKPEGMKKKFYETLDFSSDDEISGTSMTSVSHVSNSSSSSASSKYMYVPEGKATSKHKRMSKRNAKFHETLAVIFSDSENECQGPILQQENLKTSDDQVDLNKLAERLKFVKNKIKHKTKKKKNSLYQRNVHSDVSTRSNQSTDSATSEKTLPEIHSRNDDLKALTQNMQNISIQVSFTSDENSASFHSQDPFKKHLGNILVNQSPSGAKNCEATDKGLQVSMSSLSSQGLNSGNESMQSQMSVGISSTSSMTETDSLQVHNVSMQVSLASQDSQSNIPESEISSDTGPSVMPPAKGRRSMVDASFYSMESDNFKNTSGDDICSNGSPSSCGTVSSKENILYKTCLESPTETAMATTSRPQRIFETDLAQERNSDNGLHIDRNLTFEDSDSDDEHFMNALVNAKKKAILKSKSKRKKQYIPLNKSGPDHPKMYTPQENSPLKRSSRRRSSESSESDDFESFLRQQQRPVPKIPSESDEESSGMEDFVVADDQLETPASSEEEGETFYHRVNQRLEMPLSTCSGSEINPESSLFANKKTHRSTTEENSDEEVSSDSENSGEGSVSSDVEEEISDRENSYLSEDDSEDDFVFKTPKAPIVKPSSKTCNPTFRSKPFDAALTPSRNYNTNQAQCLQQNARPGSTGHSSESYGFLKSLSTHIDAHKRHAEANKFVTSFKKTKEELTAKLYKMYNETIFENKLPADMKLIWNSRMTKTAGYCVYRKNPQTPNSRDVRIELSVKVCDSPERVRDTLVHEMCHAAVWYFLGERAGHGPPWKAWVRRANLIHRDLPPISRCHTYHISTKYMYKCSKCGYQIGRHSKSIDTTKKVCGYCKGQFELLVQTPSRARGSASAPALQYGATPKAPRTPNRFALFVKENYGSLKRDNQGSSHRQVMNLLSKEFASKNKLDN